MGDLGLLGLHLLKGVNGCLVALRNHLSKLVATLRLDLGQVVIVPAHCNGCRHSNHMGSARAGACSRERAVQAGGVGVSPALLGGSPLLFPFFSGKKPYMSTSSASTAIQANRYRKPLTRCPSIHTGARNCSCPMTWLRKALPLSCLISCAIARAVHHLSLPMTEYHLW